MIMWEEKWEVTRTLITGNRNVSTEVHWNRSDSIVSIALGFYMRAFIPQCEVKTCYLHHNAAQRWFYLWTQRVPVEALGGFVLTSPAVQWDKDLTEEHLPSQGSWMPHGGVQSLPKQQVALYLILSKKPDREIHIYVNIFRRSQHQTDQSTSFFSFFFTFKTSL